MAKQPVISLEGRICLPETGLFWHDLVLAVFIRVKVRDGQIDAHPISGRVTSSWLPALTGH